MMCDYDKDEKCSYLIYSDANNIKKQKKKKKKQKNKKKKNKKKKKEKEKKELDILLNVIWNSKTNYMIYIMIIPLPLVINLL